MLYFKVQSETEDFQGVFSHPTKLKKEDIVVVPDNYDRVITAEVVCPIKTIEALSLDSDIEPIIAVVDITDWKKRNEARVKQSQLMRVMREKMELIKVEETLEKFAGKDSDFADLLKEYRQLENPVNLEIEDEELD